MMDTTKEAELTDALLRMIKVASRNLTLIEGTILSVDDEEAYTCEISVGDDVSAVTFSDVPLETVTNSAASLILVPNIGSACLVSFRDGSHERPQLIKSDSIAKIIANPTVLFQFNKGDNGGLVLVNPLVVQMASPVNDLNELKELIAEWNPVSGDGGAALKTALTGWFAKILPTTTAEDIQSKVITQ